MAARDQNTLALLGWGYSSFRLATLITADAVLARPAVADQPGTHAVVIATTSLSHVIAKGARIKIDLVLRHPLAGPIARGVIVGNATVFADGKRIGTVPLALQKAIPAVSPLTRVARFVTRASTLVLLALLLCVAAVLVVRRRQRRQAHRNTA
jgi:D-alanyl-D-alanine carboxypeptidase (penicillin-binding protein 5/6)